MVEKSKLQDVINKHGYGFQYSVVRRFEELFYERDSSGSIPSSWRFETTEFPVSVNDLSTRIDIVLKHQHKEYYLLIECKRVDSAYAWCFAKAPYVRKNREKEYCFLEGIKRSSDRSVAELYQMNELKDEAYHISFEVKSGESGDGYGATSDAIESACVQVVKGLNGMIMHFANQENYTKEKIVFLPAIITNTILFAVNEDLRNTDITTGKISLSHEPEEKQWIAYQYHISPKWKHNLKTNHTYEELSEILDMEYIRTIPIVNSNYLKEFSFWSSQWLGAQGMIP